MKKKTMMESILLAFKSTRGIMHIRGLRLCVHIFTLFLSFLSISASAQINAEIIRPSVNASQFDFAVKAETALSKGQLSLNIPLMELKGKGYDLPVSLVFYSGDVTFRTEASPVGLGWALMAGGVITKTIRGTDDLQTRYSSKEHLSNPDYILNYWTNSDSLFNIQEDPMPDEYTYALPGHSGTINVSSDGHTTTMSLYPDESYRIDSVGKGFCITADDGTKFYFEGIESRTVSYDNVSTSWFLTRIVTTKGGLFTFNYAKEEYVDFSAEENENFYEKYKTKRITSIESDFGTVLFNSTIRSDRCGFANRPIEDSLRSERINKIELRDEHGNFVKGYELDNSDSFVSMFGDPYSCTDIRHKLSSVTQYDSLGNRLPPYEFTYSYRFAKTKLAESIYLNGECLPRDSWTAYVGPQAYVDLDGDGNPSCWMMYPNTPYTYLEGITIMSEDIGPTANDYFCLTEINYPNGATDEFTYEKHSYSKVNLTDATYWFSNKDKIHGRRLATKVRYGSELEQRTEYVYQLHDSDYNLMGRSSGVMTNPSFHCATYYTPELDWPTWKLRASRLTTGKAFNNFMGPPVCYTEIEEVEKDDRGNILNRTIHYFEPQIVSPPVNYVVFIPNMSFSPCLIEIDNRIYGSRTGYTGSMAYLNQENMTYMAYPVGEFYCVAYFVDQPLKEVFIGKDGDVRSIREYYYSRQQDYTKYGYKVVNLGDNQSGNPTTLGYVAHLISMSEYKTKKYRLCGINTTRYYNNGNVLDSISEGYGMHYNKGRVDYTTYSRSNENGNNEKSITYYYFPGDILNLVGNSTSTEIEAMNGLVEKNIVADPIKTILRRDGKIIGGECKDFKMHSGVPLLKTLYKLKNTDNNHLGAPTINGNYIDYHADLYKEGEILTYDVYQNPEYVRLNDTQDRIYVWGYGGRFPVAIIDNMDSTTYQASTTLRSKLLQLATYRKIETATDCANLRVLNAEIRDSLPDSVHITTYTYDPYYGMTSETDDSNLGTIYTYDTFGRLSARYDVYYRKLEDYNYHLKLQ